MQSNRQELQSLKTEFQLMEKFSTTIFNPQETTMNAITLYLSTCRLIMKINKTDPNTWKDLYRLLPYLRQALSCTVCGNLAIEPQTPTRGDCQHHVCLGCKNGRKKLKPSCQCCRIYTEYRENWKIKAVQKCYKLLCVYFKHTHAFKHVHSLAVTTHDPAAINLMELIIEAAAFNDNCKTTVPQTDYSILPYVFVHKPAPATSTSVLQHRPVQPAPMLSALSSIAAPPLTFIQRQPIFKCDQIKTEIKQEAIEIKPKVEPSEVRTPLSTSYFINDVTSAIPLTGFKKPGGQKMGSRGSAQVRRKGCRCGNATPTPGKLTCCGQRCPCYVDSKPCLECRCRGCRNPHRADGVKVRPHIQASQNLHIHYPEPPKMQVEIKPEFSLPTSMGTIAFSTPNLKVVGLYSHDFPNQISSTVPSAILVGDDPSDLIVEHHSDLGLDI